MTVKTVVEGLLLDVIVLVVVLTRISPLITALSGISLCIMVLISFNRESLYNKGIVVVGPSNKIPELVTVSRLIRMLSIFLCIMFGLIAPACMFALGWVLGISVRRYIDKRDTEKAFKEGNNENY